MCVGSAWLICLSPICLDLCGSNVGVFHVAGDLEDRGPRESVAGTDAGRRFVVRKSFFFRFLA